MKRVFAVHTGPALMEPIKALAREIMPESDLVSVVDDSLIADVIRAGTVPAAVKARLEHYYRAAVAGGADLILNTCSSIGEAAQEIGAALPIPLVNVDLAMAEEAVSRASRIGVLATLPTTLGPTVRLIERVAAEMGKSVEVVDGLASGAFEALGRGDAAEHDRLIAETAAAIADRVALIVLAQGSMARMEQALAEASGKPVLSSPASGVRRAAEILAG